MSRNEESGGRPQLTVGIGASAGGLEAFKAFFAGLPPDSDMAFVLVQHLSPDHTSLLTEILARSCPIPVVQAEHGMGLEANRVHVIPPDATLTVENRRLLITRPAPPRTSRRPIDTFFTSLAKDQGENAICIVLSGVGSDGTIGLAAVKESGGLTIAQAEFDHHAMPGMPESAAATGLVDYVLPVEEMPARLIRYRDHLALVADRKGGDGTRTDAAEHMSAVLAILRSESGHDFTKYKTTTITRRIQRRMQVLQTDTVPAYIEHLQKDPAEADLLFRELLIGVTEFFRDPGAYASVGSALEAILKGGTGADPIRVWVAACSTGEEVYSLAITIRELLEARQVNREVQVFGTDIDDRAIEFARAGRYLRTTGLSAERLKRWWIEDDGEYFPVRQIRGMCVFSVHNVAKDPPFSRLDMISCRNLMIYMDNELQDRVVRTFHYALKPQGLLLLGMSEGVSRHTNLFSVLDKSAHIFQRRDGNASFPAMPLPAQTPAALPQPSAGNGRGAGDHVERSARRALAKHSPAFLVVDRQSNIVRYSGGEVAVYLEPSAGAASLNVISNLRPSLRTVIRTALQSVQSSGEGLVIDNVTMTVEGQQRLLSVIVEVVQDTGTEGLCVVAFREVRTNSQSSQAAAGASPETDSLAAERELRAARAQLQATVAELESANEEMTSTAEEHQSVNEELQSTNEELQTSKEEMQSINEELQTVNAEMLAKNELLSNLNSDLQNLLDSTQIATIFLDEKLRIRNFTPGMADIFSLRDSDRGRPLTDIVSLLAYEELARDVAKCLRHLALVERELDLHDKGASFTMRIRPYRSVENVIEGVVITFVDVTARKAAELAQLATQRRFAAIVSQTSVGVAEADAAGQFLVTNAAFETLVGRSAEELRRTHRNDLIHPEDQQEARKLLEQAERVGKPFETEYRLLRPDGTVRWVHDSVSMLSESDDRHTGLISVTLPIDERKRAEERAQLLLSELDHRVKNILAIVSSIVAQTLDGDSPSPELAATLQGRLRAIARAHSLLTNRGTAGPGTLRDLVDTELAPYKNCTLRIEGPDLVLTPKAGLSIAMALHELASNAAKYGCLSTATGTLFLSWEITGGPEPSLHLSWAETGGPRITAPPTQRGFGTTLIERSLVYEFDAKVDRTFAESGVLCTIEVPFTSAVGELRAASPGGT